MGRRKDAVVTEASVTPIRPIIPLAALAIWDPKPYLSWTGRSCSPAYNAFGAVETMDVSANKGPFAVYVG